MELHARWNAREFGIEYDLNGHGSRNLEWRTSFTLDDLSE
jgi:hypothetical protein